MINRIARPRRIAVWRWALSCCVVACSSDTVCVVTCVTSEAAEISVTANNAPTGIVGLTMTISGPVFAFTSSCQGLGCTSCSQGPGAKDICTIYGPPGSYQVTFSAPGYQPNVLSFTVASHTTSGGCCADLAVTQTPSVVMQPASD